MEVTKNTTKYNVTKHLMQRYSERIMGKDNSTDVTRFIADNEEKIKADINKMIEYGCLIYQGKQSQKDGKGKVIDVYLKDTYVILVDVSSGVIVTLYKIDLGLDDDFNKAYISKMLEKLNTNKEVLESVQQQVQEESNTYRELINDAEIQIKEYRTMIKNLEELCVGYKTIIDNNNVKIAQANRDVAEVLNTLIGRREF